MIARRGLSLATACVLLLVFAAVPAGAAPGAELWSFWDLSVESASTTVDHRAWQVFLDKYLHAGPDGINLVAYPAVTAADRSALDAYLRALASQDPRQLRRAEQFAYWANLYNGLTVAVVLRNPNKRSILRMGERVFSIGPWDDELITVAGQALTLNDIEHRILRPIWRDPRVHYAVNCASLGCPNLSGEAYTAANSEQLLAASEIAYINHPRGVSFDSRGRLTVSQIYDWYGDDFAADEQELRDYLARYHERLATQLRGYQGRMRYAYDWSLNGIE